MWHIDFQVLLDTIYECINHFYGMFIIDYGSIHLNGWHLFFSFIVIDGILELFFKGKHDDDDIFD